ncbi:carbonic anhydrase [Streptomyces coelicoflavus]|uniref:carbonic anhydrase n=1 Tax=Streptomyces TaxID=1883 RepID=UPI00109E85B6|nr:MULTISPECIES: carbonic anhydrase [unclassified Streptomyces]MYS46640.1 carbonic anhydrase [Streptomyces sp. SID5998]WDI21497.1 carbonic anhydrase [Streptomyces enissocaesilis]MCW1097620.1 carbonic anhydrase [Streptomyces sp. RS2]NHI06089.1 Carbonic anhydrase [Streptomyces sp. KO7888]QCB25424.1 carbonic anhydrase [Streptomyces sp. SS52]
MEYLIDQARVFRARAAAHSLDLTEHAQVRRPRAMFITCSDARLVPALLTASRPGDLYELRNQGGLIPPYDPWKHTAETRTVEHAVRDLKVTDIIVCGHSRCEAVDDAVAGDDEPSAIAAAGHWHTLTQLDQLSDYPCVTPRLADRSLRLHAWYYEVDTGSTSEYDARTSVFLPL